MQWFSKALGAEQWFFFGVKKRNKLFFENRVRQKKFRPFFTPRKILGGGWPALPAAGQTPMGPLGAEIFG